MTTPKQQPSSAGAPVDSQGWPATDPTQNVLNLVELNVRRLDDMAELRAACASELATVREKHASEMRKAEADRLDAIRAVDVGNVTRAAEVSAAQAQALAAQVATSAETLRTQQAATAAQGDVTLGTALKPLQEAIAELRKIQYEQAGSKAQTKDWLQNPVVLGVVAVGAAYLGHFIK